MKNFSLDLGLFLKEKASVPKLCNRKLQRYNKAEIHQLKGIFE
jgi:hypothetical protein